MTIASPHPFHIYAEVHVLQLERILKVARSAGMRRKAYIHTSKNKGECLTNKKSKAVQVKEVVLHHLSKVGRTFD